MATLSLGCADRRALDVALPVAAASESADPALAVDPSSGDVLLSWVAGDSAGYGMYFARSSDGGVTWSEPSVVAAKASDIKPHGESSPRLVAAPGRLALVWSNSVAAPGRRWPASNMRAARSLDGGRTWSAAVTLNDDTASGAFAGHLFHGAAWEGDSALVVAWMDSRAAQVADTTPHGHADTETEADATVYTARSPDFGAHWEAANTRRWGAACPCCRISLARNTDGALHAAWRLHFPGNLRDVVVARLTDERPSRVANDGWAYPGCPHTGPSIAIDTAGFVHMAWYTGKAGAPGIYYRTAGASLGNSGDPLPVMTGSSLPVAHPVVAATGVGQALIAWSLAPDGARTPFLMYVARNRVEWQVTLSSTTTADHPQIAVAQGHALVAWTETADGRRQVKLVRVRI